MSWTIRLIASASPTEYGYAQPWLLEAGDAGGTASLLLHAGAFDVHLNGWEDSMSPIYFADYLPADNALQKTSSVDAASGGDWDQVRSTTILVANQMADESSMADFIAAQGIDIHGASIEIFTGTPVEHLPLPAPYWTGKVVQCVPDGMTLQLTCEPDGDTDPLGTVVDASTIRPLVIGVAENVPLAIIQDEETYPKLTRTGYVSSAPLWHGQPNVYGQKVEFAEFLAQDQSSKLIYLHINALDGDDEYLDFFPGGVVTERNWFLEVVSGNGKGLRRNLKHESLVYVWRGVGDGIPHVTYGTFDTYGSWLPQNRGQLILRLKDLFVTSKLVAYTGLFTGYFEYESPLIADPYPVGAYGTRQEAAKAYMRLVRKDFRITKPEHNTRVLLKLRSGETIMPYANNDKTYDEGDRYLVVPQYGYEETIAIFQHMDLELGVSVVTEASPPEVTGDLASVFTVSGGSATIPAGSNAGISVAVLPSDLRAKLSGAKRIWLSIDADFAGSLVAGMGIEGRQKSIYVYDQDLGLNPNNAVKILPTTLWKENGPYCAVNKSYAAVSGGIKILFPWEAGFIEGGVDQSTDGIPLEMTTEVNTVQYITLSISRTDTTQPMTVRKISIHIEREANLNAFWADVIGPTYLSCPGGIDRDIGGGVIANSFAIERNAYDGIPLSSGLSSDQVIDDHAHAIEALLRISGYHGNHIDVQSIETAYWDSVCKTRTALAPESVELRPKCSLAITDVQQQGDVYAQICRDGGLIGGRDAANRRTLKAYLARTWLAEEDFALHDYYVDGTPGDFLRGTVEPGMTSLDDVVTSPLIRYCMEDGNPTRYIQVLHPEASTYNAAYCIGFENEFDAQRAWEICHKGWLRTRVIYARELTMSSVRYYSSLIKLLMPQRGCGQLEWMSQQKRTLSYAISDESAAAFAPNGSRMLLEHRLRAPGGQRGTLVSTSGKRGSGEAKQTVILDPAP